MSNLGTNKSEENVALRFDLEVLKARLDIRNFFLHHTVKQIYENVAQVLSLVRMQLGVAKPVVSIAAANELINSGELVGKSIRELRTMSKSLYPDDDILNKKGLQAAIQQAVDITNPGSNVTIVAWGSELNILAGIKLLTFKLLMEVLLSIQQIKGAVTSLSFTVNTDEMVVEVIFTSNVQHDIYAADYLEYILQNEAAKMLQPCIDVETTVKNETAILLKVPF